MRLRPLPPEVIRKMIEGHTDELTELAKERARLIEQMPCPRCRSAMEQRLHPSFAFTPDDPLPRSVACCTECGCTVDPKNGIVLDVGDATKIPDPPIPIIRGE